MITTIQFLAFQNFSDYVDQMELNKLSTLITLLGEAYEQNQSWDFIRHKHPEWTRILTSTGLIERREPGPEHQLGEWAGPPPREPPPHRGYDQAYDQGPFQRPPPGPQHGPPPGDPRPNSPGRPVSGMFETGPRLSLFDTDYNVVMGRAPSKKDHVFRSVYSQDILVGYIGLNKLKDLSNPLDVYFLEQQKKVFYLAGALFLLSSVLVSFLLARHLLSPIRKLSSATRSLAKRRFNTKLEVNTTDELGDLAQDFNTMISKLGEYELRQKQWLSDISHELRTPLAILIGEIDAVQDGIRRPDPVAIKSLQAEAFHIKRLIDDLHTLSVAEAQNLQIQKQPVDVLTLLKKVIDQFFDRFFKKGIQLKTALVHDPQIMMSGDPDRLIQLFSNLLKNSLRYTDSPGILTVRFETQDKNIALFFEDTKPGVPSDMISRLFDRLFRVDPSRNRKNGGSGLGLAICKNIVEVHGGDIKALNAASGGLQIKVEFPITT
ncbi:MAG: HAMP domain-containing protein [Desulfobacteraceae bacterium]|nr:HAMP domain-containing protein [Desulfobacteraceae bacterium]